MPDAGSVSRDNLNDHALSDQHRTALENLLKKQALKGAWGYKNITDPVERDLVLRSEAMAEKIFAVLYADNPDNARIKWQTYTSKPVDNGLLARAKNFVVERDKEQVVEKLSSQQGKIQESVDEVREDKRARTQQQRLAQLQSTRGDFEQRARDSKRRAQQTLTETDQNVDGLSVLKSFYKGGKVANEYRASRNEKKKAKWLEKEISEVMREDQDTKVQSARMKAVGPEFEADNDPAAKAAATDGLHQFAAKMTGLKGANLARSMAAAPKRFTDLLQKNSGMQSHAQQQQNQLGRGGGLGL